MHGIILKCITCKKEYTNWKTIKCTCGSILEVVHDLEKLKGKISFKDFDKRLGTRERPYNSGVWRFKELVLPIENKFIISRPEGNTNLYTSEKVAEYVGVKNLYLKAEGENPTLSFKDRGMTVAISVAKMLGYKRVACASTGNTSASMASYSAQANIQGIIFIPEQNVALGKLAQALAYGAKTLQVKGNFDSAMELVQLACKKLNMYLLNSINPFRIEGQKTIAFEALQQLNWQIPDWFILPGGNLGNSSAVGKAFKELYELGLIKKVPRLAIIQAEGANPLYKSYKKNFREFSLIKNPKTIATAIRIGNPISWKKAVYVIKFTKGVVEEVSDQEILDAKVEIDRSGIGCEPASAASVAGVKKLVEKGIIKKNEKIVAVLTGNMLKDPDIIINYNQSKVAGLKTKSPNLPIKIKGTIEEIEKILRQKNFA